MTTQHLAPTPRLTPAGAPAGGYMGSLPGLAGLLGQPNDFNGLAVRLKCGYSDSSVPKMTRDVRSATNLEPRP
jgi:hypothetical protein